MATKLFLFLSFRKFHENISGCKPENFTTKCGWENASKVVTNLIWNQFWNFGHALFLANRYLGVSIYSSNLIKSVHTIYFANFYKMKLLLEKFQFPVQCAS